MLYQVNLSGTFESDYGITEGSLEEITVLAQTPKEAVKNVIYKLRELQGITTTELTSAIVETVEDDSKLIIIPSPMLLLLVISVNLNTYYQN